MLHVVSIGHSGLAQFRPIALQQEADHRSVSSFRRVDQCASMFVVDLAQLCSVLMQHLNHIQMSFSRRKHQRASSFVAFGRSHIGAELQQQIRELLLPVEGGHAQQWGRSDVGRCVFARRCLLFLVPVSGVVQAEVDQMRIGACTSQQKEPGHFAVGAAGVSMRAQ